MIVIPVTVAAYLLIASPGQPTNVIKFDSIESCKVARMKLLSVLQKEFPDRSLPVAICVEQ